MPYHYHYDKDSFLAGLAVGRALWRPPEAPHGWICDPAYRVYFADTELCTVSGRLYIKEQNGMAVGVFAKNWRLPSGLWTGPVLISTDPDAVRYYYGSTHLGVNVRFEYLGLTWCMNWDHHFQNPRTYDYGVLVPYDAHGLDGDERLGRDILRTAGVVVY